MREPHRTHRMLVDLMLREAEQARQYVEMGRKAYFDASFPGVRDGLRLHVLQLVESATKLGKAFRAANPGIPWEMLLQLRQNLVHNYPGVSPEAVLTFAVQELPRIARGLRSTRFPAGAG